MFEEEKQTPPLVIALPPLRMAMVHALNERANQADPQFVMKNVAIKEEKIKVQSLIKIIEHLEHIK